MVPIVIIITWKQRMGVQALALDKGPDPDRLSRRERNIQGFGKVLRKLYPELKVEGN